MARASVNPRIAGGAAAAFAGAETHRHARFLVVPVVKLESHRLAAAPNQTAWIADAEARRGTSGSFRQSRFDGCRHKVLLLSFDPLRYLRLTGHNSGAAFFAYFFFFFI
jgi:hypothetical protein